MAAHRRVLWGSLIGLTGLLVTLVFGLSYQEDISDFLPYTEQEKEDIAIYQDVAGANRLVLLFSHPASQDTTAAAIRRFLSCLETSDTARWCDHMTARLESEAMSTVADFVYAYIPYFLTEDDYERLDSLLTQPHYLDEQLAADRQSLLSPTGAFLTPYIARDPLHLFTPVFEGLRHTAGQFPCQLYDGFLFTPDGTRAIVTIPSPFGHSETQMNARLVAMLHACCDSVRHVYPTVDIHVTGGPQIAVSNAAQIRHDSLLALSLASVLILALLVYAFRQARHIVLIAVAVAWGWLFALAAMALLRNSLSLIVIGIASVILGIAVNYPLHLIAHTQHQPCVRAAVREIAAPLLIGNITTVGAFLVLVPLHAVALSDLGWFAAFLLIGTIAFVLVYLPHLIHPRPAQLPHATWLARLTSRQIKARRWQVCFVACLTVFFAYHSLHTEFDANLSHINYMTQEQRDDMAYFQRLFLPDSTAREVTLLYVASSAATFEEALLLAEQRQPLYDSLLTEHQIVAHQGICRYVASPEEQAKRRQRWQAWTQRHADLLPRLAATSRTQGFTPEAFADFRALFTDTLPTLSFAHFAPLTQQVFAQHLSHDAASGRASVVDVLTVENSRTTEVSARLPHCINMTALNSRVAHSLSDDFNYIGLACSAIVFIFLWASFRSLALAVIAFVPMAVSWVWILGLMSLLGIQFNIVNIILATFIFGQGDDYTIFITEGCISQYIHHQDVLASYQHSILLSALIMFIGIGTLILARHPALHSLAEVTIVGMSSVVLMAYVIPPVLFSEMRHLFPQWMQKR